LDEEAVSIAGLLGKPDDFVGDLVVATNRYALGVNEDSIVSSMRNFATKLIVEEHKIRQQISKQESAEIKDRVARSFGALIHSYQIETVEALNEIALLKLCLEMGWIKGITMVELNKLFFSCRRAHLIRAQSEKVLLENVGHKRAEFIHQSLKQVSLLI
jgi:protein arginine kinase